MSKTSHWNPILFFKPFCIKGFHPNFIRFDGIQPEVQPKQKSLTGIIVIYTSGKIYIGGNMEGLQSNSYPAKQAAESPNTVLCHI